MNALRSPAATRRRTLGSEKGQTLLEMAMILPLLMGLLVGILEFGRAWNVRQVTTNAAREGARLAILESSEEGEVRAAVEAHLVRAGLDPDVGEISITGMNDPVGDPVTIAVRYPYTFTYLGPILGLLDTDDSGDAPGTFVLEGEIAMRNE
ncbi:MAG TPA: TadE/TadG family type IV pilus assembly protein [Gemmatimonadota bacterium]|nr:TadE/TadG family type IV pilus assembly protein [Gemmatimonadota bacterium]